MHHNLDLPSFYLSPCSTVGDPRCCYPRSAKPNPTLGVCRTSASPPASPPAPLKFAPRSIYLCPISDDLHDTHLDSSPGALSYLFAISLSFSLSFCQAHRAGGGAISRSSRRRVLVSSPHRRQFASGWGELLRPSMLHAAALAKVLLILGIPASPLGALQYCLEGLFRSSEMRIGGGVGHFEMFTVGSWFRSFRAL
ncbi:uncharacterized protein [Physcomitrium patens]|uniref:uncharacterized protein isoform X2 n=1 Tax=Physcomitrium patens TaxID=3218 RepID=UPI000D1668F4|nr:uncharacterized protein LOC112294933 isoform X2 [Physcomitrium patens]|eukprot:XP_024401705.1 uncharacterized protein LOC112294933 isoform X2 [Physcomitrella patens]